MKLTIHRGCHEIGGSCVELQSGSDSLFIDFGMPLTEKDGTPFDANSRANKAGPELVESGDLPDISGLYRWQERLPEIRGLLLSHSHTDHCGFARHIHPQIPVYAGEPTHRLLELNSVFTGAKLFTGPKRYFKHKEIFKLGPFNITPYTVDHSAFDAYAFLIEAGGKCLLYSGDLRDHGRKFYTLSELIDSLKNKTVDALILEGTMLSNLPGRIKKESELEEEAVNLLQGTAGIALVYGSAHNADRIVTLYRAAKRCNRLFVIDIYTANVLALFNSYARIPYPSRSYDGLRVFYQQFITSKLCDGTNDKLTYKFSSHKIIRNEITAKQSKIVMFVRPSMINDLGKIEFTAGANYIYSIWKGSQEESKNARLIDFARQKGMAIHHIHTSGHASVETLSSLISALNPKMVIPIHTMAPEDYSIFNAKLMILQDGKSLNL